MKAVLEASQRSKSASKRGVARVAAREHGWPAATVTSAAVTIARSRDEVYTFWRDFAHLPRFMGHVKGIEALSPQRSRWTVKAPLGKTVE